MFIHVFLHRHQISFHCLNKTSGVVHPLYNVKLFVIFLVIWKYESILIVLYRMSMKPIWIVLVSVCHLKLFCHVLFHHWCASYEIPSTDKEWFLSKMFLTTRGRHILSHISAWSVLVFCELKFCNIDDRWIIITYYTVLNRCCYDRKTYGGMEVKLHTSLTSVLGRSGFRHWSLQWK
jgi:hypothetical protein